MLNSKVGIDDSGYAIDLSFSLLRWTVSVLVGATFLVASWFLVPRILRPTVIPFPWRLPESRSYRARDKMGKVVMAGSFNPPHSGHLAMLEYLSKR